MNRLDFFLIKLFLILLISQPLTGQEKQFNIKNYSIRDGLPGRLVLDITRDQTGLIWVATNKGLSRFDGYEFENLDNFG